MPTRWPQLAYDSWSATCDTLHAHTQVLPFFDERIIDRCAELEMAAYADVGEPAPA